MSQRKKYLLPGGVEEENKQNDATNKTPSAAADGGIELDAIPKNPPADDKDLIVAVRVQEVDSPSPKSGPASPHTLTVATAATNQHNTNNPTLAPHTTHHGPPSNRRPTTVGMIQQTSKGTDAASNPNRNGNGSPSASATSATRSVAPATTSTPATQTDTKANPSQDKTATKPIAVAPSSSQPSSGNTNGVGSSSSSSPSDPSNLTSPTSINSPSGNNPNAPSASPVVFVMPRVSSGSSPRNSGPASTTKQKIVRSQVSLDMAESTRGGADLSAREGERDTLATQESSRAIRINPTSEPPEEDAEEGDEEPEREISRKSPSAMRPTTHGELQGEEVIEYSDEVEVPPGFIHPSHPYLVVWSHLLMIVALYNTFTVPYRWVFWSDPQPITWDVVLLLILDSFGDIFFLLEMAKNFRVGFVEDGRIVFDPVRIRRHYMTSWWFILDIVTCLPFDLIQIGFDKLLPPVRILKVLRTFQLWHHINFIEATRSVSLSFKLTKLFFYTCIIAHVAACCKYPIIMKNPTLSLVFEDKSEFKRYLLTLYWGMGSLIDRGDNNAPYKVADFLVSNITMFVGVLWVSNFVAAMDQYTDSSDATKKRHLEEYKQVKMFMSKFGLPDAMQNKVKAYYSYLWASPARYDLNDTIDKLSETLRSDVLVVTNATLSQSSLFEGVSRGFLANLLSKVRREIGLPQEMLCTYGHTGLDIYFIEDGLVEVLVGTSQHDIIATLRTCEHFGEFSVLFGIPRSASVRSVNYCTLVVLGKDDLEESFELFPQAEAIVRSNAQKAKQRAVLQEKSFVAMSQQKTNGSQRTKLQQLMRVETLETGPTKPVAKTFSPQEPWYLVWETVHILVVFWNSIMVPYQIAFERNTVNPYTMAINYLGDVFLIADSALCFRVRYMHNGSEVTDVNLIFNHYVKGRFLLHLAGSLPLDFLMISTGMEPWFRLNKVLRIIDAHDLINQRIRDSRRPDVYALLYLCLNLFFISHWFASIYWIISLNAGFLEDPDSEGWQPSSVHADEADSFLDYLTSLYWALGLLIGYGASYYPPTYYAIIFTLVIQLVGLFLISYLIGVLGNTAGTLQVAATAATEEVDLVTEAFNFHNWNTDLLKRVQTYLKHKWDMQTGIDPNEAILRLPVSLRSEIMSIICGPTIRGVRRLSAVDDASLKALTAELRFAEIPSGEYVFRQGYLGDTMYFISKGCCDIVVDNGSNETVLKAIGPSCFFGEGALFSGVRAASVRCTTSVLLYALSSESLLQIMHVAPAIGASLLSAHQLRKDNLEQLKSQAGIKSGRSSVNPDSARNVTSHIHAPLTIGHRATASSASVLDDGGAGLGLASRPPSARFGSRRHISAAAPTPPPAPAQEETQRDISRQPTFGGGEKGGYKTKVAAVIAAMLLKSNANHNHSLEPELSEHTPQDNETD